MNAKERYKALCKERSEIGLFQNSVWLDAIAPDNWDVALATKGSEILGALPYFHKRKMGFSIITMPPLTPYLGPVLFYPSGQKPPARVAFEKEIIGLLVEKLPKTDKFIQYFLPSFQNALPFQWAGFEQSVRYTYLIEDTSNAEDCWNGLQGNIRRAIKKAQSNFSVQVANDSSELFRLKKADYQEKGLELEFDSAYLDKCSKALLKHEMGKLSIATDQEGKVISACLFGWDNEYLHYVAGSLDPEFRNSGALSLLLWDGIQLASEKGLKFNFEGGMFQSIEKYFRGFGAEPLPYFQISKVDSKLLNLL